MSNFYVRIALTDIFEQRLKYENIPTSLNYYPFRFSSCLNTKS